MEKKKRKHKPRLTLIIDEKFKKKIQMKAIQKEVDVSSVVTGLLEKWLREG